MLPGEFEQLPAELAGKQDGPDLALEGDVHPSVLGGLYGDIPHLGDADAGSADSFQQKRQPFGRRRPQPFEVALGQVPGGIPEGAALELEELHTAVLPAQEAEQAVDSGDFSVNGGRREALGEKMRLPFCGQLSGDRFAVQPGDKGSDIPQVFLDGGRGTLLLTEESCVGGNVRLWNLAIHVEPSVNVIAPF